MALTSTAAVVQNQFSSVATDPLRNFKFLVDIYHAVPGENQGNSLSTLGFVSVSGLSVVTESIAYRQGGYNTTVHQIPGQTTFTPVTLQRGVLVGTRQTWDWMRELFSVVAGNGLGAAGNDFRTYVDIAVLDHPITANGTPSSVDPASQYGTGAPGGSGLTTPVKMRFRLYNAWISALSYSDLNAGDNSVLIEQMTLMHEGFDVNWASNQAGSSAPDF